MSKTIELRWLVPQGTHLLEEKKLQWRELESTDQGDYVTLAWQDVPVVCGDAPREMSQREIDLQLENAKLRSLLDTCGHATQAYANTRNAVLEEAAKVADNYEHYDAQIAYSKIAAAIRALKDPSNNGHGEKATKTLPEEPIPTSISCDGSNPGPDCDEACQFQCENPSPNEHEKDDAPKARQSEFAAQDQ